MQPVVLQGFERRLEHLVEGAFARVFRSGLRPVELGRRLVRQMDLDRTIDVRGRPLAPNAFVVHLATEDLDRFAEIHDALVKELCDAARDHGREESYAFMGPIAVELVEDDRMRTGQFEVEAHFVAGEGGTGAGSLVLPTGDRYVLGDHAVVIGRLPDCEITVLDSNVSRRHAKVEPRGDAFVVVDLGSTNGTRINGVRVAEHQLRDGDEVTVGNTRLVFEAS